jgi:hypothetical protein
MIAKSRHLEKLLVMRKPNVWIELRQYEGRRISFTVDIDRHFLR